MKRWIGFLVVPTLVFSLTVPTLAVGPGQKKPGKGPETTTVKALGASAALPAGVTAGSAAVGLSDFTVDTSYAEMSADEAWEQFAQAEAYKKLYEMQARPLREQLRLLEGPGAYYYYYNGDGAAAYSQLMELKNQEYELKLLKEQYEWQKKQAESYLKLIGEKPDRAQLEYAFYTNAATVSGLSYEELYTQRLELQGEEQQLKWQLESLEYQYQLEQISDSDFVAQFAALFRQKEAVKVQREQVDLEIQLLLGQMGPGMAMGPGAGLLP
ncbi:hypothetical protein ACTQ33_01170 [Candidatus Avoscillospira sp. LCP25S3_F1]|uniref:hypothetical protein n=1 Tax=Candidatus Avoscillospira sp. LCP25S3_F1 TaxID=3438825 RepID=UPI003F8FD06C